MVHFGEEMKSNFYFIIINFLLDLYWSIIASQYRVSFCGTTKRISHMHTHVPISPLSIYFYFYFLALPQGMQGLSSPTRDQTRAPCSGSGELNHWTAREVRKPKF